MTTNASSGMLTLPYQEVRLALQLTAGEAGCHHLFAGALAQSAWHLTNRGLGGVGYVIRYIGLLLRHPDIDRTALVTLGHETAALIGGDGRRGRALKIPNAPLLVLPFASELLRNEAETDAILFTFDDCSIVYSKTHGIRILSGEQRDIEHVAVDYFPACSASRIDYSDPGERGIDLGFTRYETLSLPGILYRGEGRALDTDLISRL